MTKGTAKIKKTASKVGAVLTGKVGVLSTLEGEHSEVSTLMDDVTDTENNDKKRDYYRKIRQDLLIHTQGEEQGVYAELKNHESMRTMTERAIREHAEIKQLISTLDRLAIGTPQWTQNFDSLKRAVQSHVDFEEEQLFAKAKDVLSADMLRKLDDSYRAYRKRTESSGELLSPPKAASGM